MTDTVEVTVGSGDVFADLGMKREIGDMVEFVDEANVRWRGALLDIRRGVNIDGAFIPEASFVGYEAAYPSHTVEPWGFVAIIAQPHTVAVRLPLLAIVEKGWWHKKPAHPNRTPQKQRQHPASPEKGSNPPVTHGLHEQPATRAAGAASQRRATDG